MSIRNREGFSPPKEAWIALAHVMPRAGEDLLEGARGAFVNVVGPAESSAEFEHRLRELLASLGFDLIEIDDLELMSERRSKYSLTEELQEIVDLSETSGEITLGAFHTYEDVDDLM